MSEGLEAKGGNVQYSNDAPAEIKKYQLNFETVRTVEDIVTVLTYAGFAAYTGQDNLDKMLRFLVEVPNDDI